MTLRPRAPVGVLGAGHKKGADPKADPEVES